MNDDNRGTSAIQDSSQSTDREEGKKHEQIQSWIKTGTLVVVAIAVVAAILEIAFGDLPNGGMDGTGVNVDATGWLFAMIALLISGVYVFTTFRIDRGVKSEARETALEFAREIIPQLFEKETQKFLNKHADKLKAKANEKLQSAEEQVERQVNASSEAAEKKIGAAIEKAKANADKRVEEAAEQIEQTFREDITGRLKSEVQEIALDTYRRLSFWKRLFPGRAKE